MNFIWTRFFLLYIIILLLINSPSAKAKKTIPSGTESVSLQASRGLETLQTTKSLDRQYDPLIVPGDLLETFHRLHPDNFRLFAYNGGQLEAVPFQIDERGPDGEFIFTHGKTASADIDNGFFDYNDELLFMSLDTGGRCPEKLWKKLGQIRAEIIVTDPKDVHKKGWVYLIYFKENPPPLSNKDYVHYSPEEETIYSKYYTMRYHKGAPFYMDLSYPKEAGGNGKDFIDRIKTRVEVKAFFNLINIKRSEEDFTSDVIGWRDGPIRVLRGVENYFRILFKLSSPSLFSVNEYYLRLTTTPVQLTIPFNLKYVFNSFGISDWTWTIYGDFPGLKGGMSYSDRNLNGYRFTGNQSEDFINKNVDVSRFTWGYTTKEGVGTWFPNLLLPEILYGVATLYVVDNEKYADPPDEIPGLIGAGMKAQWKGINEDLWFLLEKGTYELSLDTYFPHPSIDVDEAEKWLDIRGFPLWVEINDISGGPVRVASSGESPALSSLERCSPESRENSQKKTSGFCGKVTDVRGRNLTIKKLSFYAGSSRVTPREFIIGRIFNKDKYYRPEFQDILRLEHRFTEEDPISGLKNPMVQKLIMRNGKVVELLGCKPCGFGGQYEDGKKVFLWDTQIKSIDFSECPAS